MFDVTVEYLLNSVSYVFLAILFVMAIAVRIMLTLNRREKEAAKRLRDDQEKTKKERGELQTELCNNAFNQLSEVARKNVHCNILPSGMVSEDVERIKILPMPNNGTAGYSIVPWMRDRQSILGGVNIFQLDINLEKKGKEIHVYDCFERSDQNYPIEQFQNVISDLCKKIRDFSLFC